MTKKKLLRRLLLVFLFLALALILIFSFLFYMENRHEIRTQYENLALSYAKTGSDYINGDRVETYLKSGKTDAYYDEVMKFLTIQLKNSELKYYYVIIPYEEDFVYAWDAKNTEDEKKLGERETYAKGEKEIVQAAFQKNPRSEALFGSYEEYGRLVSLYYPVYNSSGEPVALVGADLSLPGMNRILFRMLGIMLICMIPVVLISVFLAFRYLQKHIVRPIQALQAVTCSMVDHIKEQDSIVLAIRTGDEIEELARSYETMYQELKVYIGELSRITAEREREKAELSIASQIQLDMLPSIFPAFPEREEFDLFALMDPAKEVGGDFYDYFMVDQDHLALVIADVSGKGVPAAMFMVIAKTLIKNAVQMGLSPKMALEQVNNQLCENNETGMFVTVWLAILTLSKGDLLCANAGHEYPALCRQNGSFELFRDRHGLMLAGMENMKYTEYELHLKVGDVLFVYTDGVTEAMNTEKVLFGTERMLKALEKGKTDPCEKIISQVHKDIKEFGQDSLQSDDITMLCLRYRMKREMIQTTEITLDRQPVLTKFLENTLESWQVPAKIGMKLNIALDEIFSNIVKYSGAGWMRMICGIRENEIILRFEDDGVPFDPTSVQEADTKLSAEERKIGGLGIFMVKKSMDRMEYRHQDQKNILTLGMKYRKEK